MSFYDALFVLPLSFGVLLVLAMALGLLHLDGHDLHAEVDHAGEAEHPFFEMLGVGRVPLMVLLLLLTLIFGGVGVVLRPLFARLWGDQTGFLASWLCASITSLFATRTLSGALHRLMPGVESYASSKQELVGRVGTVVLRLSASELLVRVSDEGGGEMRVRAALGASEALPVSGARVLLTAYEADHDRYLAERLVVD